MYHLIETRFVFVDNTEHSKNMLNDDLVREFCTNQM